MPVGKPIGDIGNRIEIIEKPLDFLMQPGLIAFDRKHIVGDAVILEASCGCFYCADRIETTGESGIPTVHKPSETIVVHSAPLAEQITLLVTIPGITPLTAAAFLADIGDVRRFNSFRQMNAYLGLVPRCHDSDGKSRRRPYHPRVT